MNLTFSFLADGEELQLPVSPVPFGWGTGSSPRELTVNGTGTLYLPGDPAARRGSLSFLLPAHNYPFCSPGAVLDPYHYIEIFDRWIRAKKLVRYVVPGVINARVVLEELTYEERDGSGDVYATLYLAESPALEAVIPMAERCRIFTMIYMERATIRVRAFLTWRPMPRYWTIVFLKMPFSPMT